MPVLTVRTDEELLRRLEALAKRRGLTRSALVKQLLQEALEREALPQVDPLRGAVRALREGRKPPKAGEWTCVEEDLARTEAQFPTVEAAIAASRGRPDGSR
jgi:predicted transcriptional regulator